MKPSVDFHIHSTFSDGRLTPTEIFKTAQDRSLTAISLTDHDTTAGIPEILSCQKATDNIQILPGIELSTFHSLASLHILGYGINHNDAELQINLAKIQQARESRNLAILVRLNDLGFDLSLSEINPGTKGQTGRPHIANLLVRKGIVQSENEAFIRFLKKDAAAYVAREELPVKKAIEIIQQAGGLAVLAHPASSDPTCVFIAELVKALKPVGLRGIEVFHPMHNKKHIRYYTKLCNELNLIPTGGSDFHGRKNEPVPIGQYSKTKLINPELWHNLEHLL